MHTRLAALITLLAFAATFALVAGWRLAAEAPAVVVGVLAGVCASVPMSLAVVWLASRRAWAARPRPPAPEPAPRIVVVPAAPGPVDECHSQPERQPSGSAVIGGREDG